ncbi:hypothetical protein GCM10010399_84270 [Dactylosporangium fulvum]|uniref:Uncharacterized protein n=1 Tax=Dactylosporangium fulvum TaxID=53359 RepID=A0ABY5VUE5_9ACTN|nr:hypothetical protein [Dactylosporangium fulvum]UWP79406.1 hypothetical protein Dfulv_30085 [Dactylosporangium fulvum]
MISPDVQPTVDFSAVAADHGAALHGPVPFEPDVDEAVEDELVADAEEVPFDLGADVAHPGLPHAGPGFDVGRDTAH